MRALGAVLLMAGCAALGFGWTALQRKRIALLSGLLTALEGLRAELLQRGAPLAEILERQAPPLLEQPFSQMAAALRNGDTADRAAAPLLAQLTDRWELPEAARALAALCRVLGRYDAPTQAEACLRAEEELSALREGARRNLQERGKLYRTVPLALGAMAAIAIW